MIIIMLPLFFLGMYEKDGMPPETVAKLFIQAKFIRPKIRPFQTDNYYAVLMRQDKERKEIEKIVCRTEKDINRKPKAAKNGNSKKSEQSGQKTCAGYTRKGG